VLYAVLKTHNISRTPVEHILVLRALPRLNWLKTVECPQVSTREKEGLKSFKPILGISEKW